MSHSSEEGSDPTFSFEIISNESTKVRVLDVPGFFGWGHTGADIASAIKKTQHTIDVELRKMRMILQIQATMQMKFCRILYFLPSYGALKRVDSHLETELSIFSKYFGKSIFNCMVVAATMPAEAFMDGNRVTFSDGAIAQTKHYFGAALSHVFPGEKDLPSPPIIFISMTDTCETVLANVMNAPVACDHIVLAFNTLVCARCGSKAKVVNSEKVVVFTDETEMISIPYDESTCHPLLVPKYTKVDRIVGGVAHILTFGKYLRRWPNFFSFDEECVRCRKAPGSRGCTQVMTIFEMYNQHFMVDHTSNTTEPIAFKFEEDEHRAAKYIVDHTSDFKAVDRDSHVKKSEMDIDSNFQHKGALLSIVDDKSENPALEKRNKKLTNTNIPLKSIFYTEAIKQTNVSFVDHYVLECDFSGIEYTNKKHNFSLRIPEGAIPVGEKFTLR